MDRAEATGLGVATVGHVALLAAITYGLATTRLPGPRSDPIEVAFVEEAALESTSPTPLAAEPAPLAGPQDGPPAPAMPAPPELQQVPEPQPQAQPQPRPEPQPQARPQPQPRPQAKPQPQPRAAAPKPAPAAKPQPRAPALKSSAVPRQQATPRRNASGLNSIVAGLSERQNSSRSTTPPAAAAGPEVKASLGRLVREQLRPHWKSPSGADAELLRTELSIWLGRDGSVTRVEVIGTSGQTASNRPQVKLHQEQALRAVRLASPFNLPDKFYDAWKYLSPIGFD
ncbi:MAG TPA: TonB C-terminal domain-containing protein, partial [Allosphingosinicella sp.]